MVKLTPLILATLATLILASPEASARCIMSYCKDGAATRTGALAARSYITNTHRIEAPNSG